MRLLLTAVGAEGAADTAVDPAVDLAVDLAVDCDDDARIADLAAELATLPVLAAAAVVQPVAGNPLGVVRAAAPSVAPQLWWSGRPLDPAEPVSTSPLRHGAVVGVGRPVEDVLAEPIGLVEVRIVSGAGAGRVQRLAPGTYRIGGGDTCTLQLADPMLPDVAVWVDVDVSGRVTVRPDAAVLGRTRPAPHRVRPLDGPIVVLRDATSPTRPSRWRRRKRRRFAADELLAGDHDNIDPQADIPLVHVDRRPVDSPLTWVPGESLAVGRVMLDLAPVAPPDASLSPTHGGATLDYNRPPRLLPAPHVTDFALPSEPRKPDKMPLPLALMLAPAVMAVGMYLLTRSVYSLLFVAMSPVMAMATYSSGRNTAKRQYRRQMQEYARRRQRVRDDAFAALAAERTLRRRDLADPATLLVTATGPRVRLWERRPTDPDWLLARVGTADVASTVSVRDPERELHEGPVSWTAPDLPVAVPLAEVGVTGLAGPDHVRRAIGRWLVAQAAVLHSPADLEIVLLADRDSGPEWSWVRWLPHARPADGGPIARAAADDEAALALMRDLISRMQARAAQLATTGGASVPLTPILVVLDGARRLRLLPGMVSLLQDGPRVGIYFLCLDADQRQLPEECRAVVSLLDPRTGDLRVSVSGRPEVDGVRPDLVDVAWCERVARALAPIRDVSSEDLAGSLPSSSRLLTVLDMPDPDPATIARRWQSNGRTTQAVVGEGLDGPFALDIRRDGPHGLVAGTTGSGKSELLQTIIASLAAGNRPDEMTFVLIDYKGGAAFKDCDHLPHTVGMVTDLDGHLTTRALESLGAELRRREHQLAAAGAKDIEDYLAGRGPRDEPMPRLLIVIDEFAALVGELPDFVTGLVDIARRGRSLGVHLILATQRPAGVVSAEIKSNTNLRIALRVTDANDSQDVIESGDAATISKSTPGRAYARLGHSSLIPFQSSRVGGRPRGADGSAAVRARPFEWATLASVDAAVTAVTEEDVSVPTDLATLVDSLCRAAELAQVQAPASPWLPPLPETLTLEDAAALLQPVERDDIAPLVFGVVDIPSQQTRAAATYDLVTGGHLCVAGAARSGRSTALRAIAGAAARSAHPRDVHLYGVDCGNNALLPLVALPHTGAVVTRDQPDRISRLTSRLLQTIATRQQLLAERGFADLREQRAHAEPEDRLPYLLVLFDRWEGFVSAFENVDAGRFIDEWMQILQEGTGVGVKVVLTADRSALVGRLSTLIDDKLLLRLVDSADFGAIGLPVKQVPVVMPPGRGFRSEGIRETQIALLAADPAGSAQVAALQQLGREAPRAPSGGPQRPFRVDALPARITFEDARALDREPTLLPVAVGGDTLALLGFDPVEHGPGILIAGPRRSGRSTALRVLAESADALGWQIAMLTPRQSPLRDSGPAAADRFTAAAPREELSAALDALATAEHSLLVIDDLELLGVDGWLVDLITDHLGRLRDSESLVAAAGSLDDLSGVYRGPAVALKKSRSGLLLTPQSPGDGDLFGMRIPRSAVGGPGLPGRGLLVRGGSPQGVQVVWPG